MPEVMWPEVIAAAERMSAGHGILPEDANLILAFVRSVHGTMSENCRECILLTTRIKLGRGDDMGYGAGHDRDTG